MHLNVVKHATVVASEDEVRNLRDPVAGELVFQHVKVSFPTRAYFEIQYGFLRDLSAGLFNPQGSFVFFSPATEELTSIRSIIEARSFPPSPIC